MKISPWWVYVCKWPWWISKEKSRRKWQMMMPCQSVQTHTITEIHTHTGMHMHTSNGAGTSVRHRTSGLVKRWGGVWWMLCYSFISHCCPLVLIMVGSFKLELGVLQKQSCPFCVFYHCFCGTLRLGAKGVYVCVCQRARSLCLYFLQSASLFIHLSICICTHIFVIDEHFVVCVCVRMLACALPCMCRTGLPYFPGTAAIGLDWCVTQAGTLKGERPGQTWSC